MSRKLTIAAMAVVAVLGFVGTSMAADHQLNLYGASAQFAFWNTAAKPFLTGTKGCTVTSTQLSADLKNGVTQGSSCTGGDTFTIRYSSKASYDGILSLNTPAPQTRYQGSAYAAPCMVGDAACGGGTVPGTPGATAWNYRKMLCDTTSNATTNIKCVKVDVGASDVAASSFEESSSGCLKGANTTGWPGACTGANFVTRTFNGIDTTSAAYNANGPLAAFNPMIVPFGIYANNAVSITKCLAPDPTTPDYAPTGTYDPTKDKAVSAWGNQCYDPSNTGHSQDCVGYYKCISNACVGGVNKGQHCYSINECPDVALSATKCERVPIDNVSRMMLTMIYSGSAFNWQDFGAWYNGAVPTTGADPIIACLRHAGSGTAATFHIMMKGGGWGVPEASFPTADTTGGPNYQFSDGTADMMKCVAGYDLTHTLGQNIGAIGYADCDVLAATPFSNPTSGTLNFPYELVHQLKLDGIECKAAKVRDGEYPFYTIEWMYYDPTNAEKSLISDLATFAGNGLNYASIAFTNGPNSQGSEGDFWDSFGEMNYLKGSDFSWPTYVGGNGDRHP